MTRSGYSDDGDWTEWDMLRARGAYVAAVRGKRGQVFLRELVVALDAMPVKELIEDELQADGAYCALGVVGLARGIDLSSLDTHDHAQLAEAFGVSETLARNVMHENDDSLWYTYDEPQQKQRQRRWQRVRDWAERELNRRQS